MGAEGELIQFPVAIVRQHAGTVDGVSDAMETARCAVHEVSMDTQAYGQFCRFLPVLLSPVFGLAVDALQESVGALQETASKLRTAATSTGSTDMARSEKINAVTARRSPAMELAL